MRKSVWIAESSVRNPVAGIEIVEPQPCDPDDVARVHDSSYVAALREGARRRHEAPRRREGGVIAYRRVGVE